MRLLKYVAARLPHRYQQELKRYYFAGLIRKGAFQQAIENEGEFRRLHQWVGPGNWVLDVGANVGNYAARLSELVGSEGRVLAFEPVLQTFELLAANVARFAIPNVTLFNVAASNRFVVQDMQMPMLETGAANPYMAHLTEERSGLSVLCMPLDSLGIQQRVHLVKIDVEGHELQALQGLTALIDRDHPVLIVEGRSPEVSQFLAKKGYSFQQDPGSPNRVFT